MEFHDALHGPFELGLPFNKALFEDLLASPEVVRLRSMRLMNFDVPLIQELGSAKRLPHSVGVCKLAQDVGQRWLSSREEISNLMVAALLHDAAIPPYGHLVEAMLRKRNPDFNHERILRELVFGTYHSHNRYHQILPSRSLMLSQILDRHGVDADKVLSLVQPSKGSDSAISSQIDLDNIDNIHRMACLLGWRGAKKNLRSVMQNARLDEKHRLSFDPDSLEALRTWQDIRQRIYTLIIAHPACVAQNAFQSDLARASIDVGIVEAGNWYITEPEFEEKIRRHPETREFGQRLIAGSNYELLDYVWFTSVGDPPCDDWMTVDARMSDILPDIGLNETYFSWVESGLVSRPISVRLSTGERKEIGRKSTSYLIARVHTNHDGIRVRKLKQAACREWRDSVIGLFNEFIGGWDGDVQYPEDYIGNYFPLEDDVKQLELC